MSRERASVTVRIAGEEHTIRANAEPAYTRKCAQLVDERIQEIRSKSGLIEGHKAAILAALSIADEYFQAVDEAHRVGAEVASRATNLARRLEAALAPEPLGGSDPQPPEPPSDP
jgi:cell division protein ZapA